MDDLLVCRNVIYNIQRQFFPPFVGGSNPFWKYHIWKTTKLMALSHPIKTRRDCWRSDNWSVVCYTKTIFWLLRYISTIVNLNTRWLTRLTWQRLHIWPNDIISLKHGLKQHLLTNKLIQINRISYILVNSRTDTHVHVCIHTFATRAI